MYKNIKETTHVEVGEEDIHHHIYVYISKIIIMCVNMVTRPVYKKKKLKETPTTRRRKTPLP